MPPEVAERVDRALRDSTGANIDSDVNPHLAQQIARVAMQATLVPATCPHCGHELLDEERAAAARMVLSAMRSEGKR
jgi:predicted Zn-ribbon and HTH transcriptional regulator